MFTHNLSRLVAELSTHAKVIQDHLEAYNYAGLSLDTNAPIEVLLDLSNIEIREARATFLKSFKLIHDLTSGSQDLLMNLIVNIFIHLIWKLYCFDLF